MQLISAKLIIRKVSHIIYSIAEKLNTERFLLVCNSLKRKLSVKKEEKSQSKILKSKKTEENFGAKYIPNFFVGKGGKSAHWVFEALKSQFSFFCK